MKLIPFTIETEALSRRIVWFEEPTRALRDTSRFMAYAFTYAVHDDMQVIRSHLTDDDMRHALKHAPPGIIDPRSWTYWHLVLDLYPPPPLPQRQFHEMSLV
jgi:hypothetical protein